MTNLPRINPRRAIPRFLISALVIMLSYACSASSSAVSTVFESNRSPFGIAVGAETIAWRQPGGDSFHAWLKKGASKPLDLGVVRDTESALVDKADRVYVSVCDGDIAPRYRLLDPKTLAPGEPVDIWGNEAVKCSSRIAFDNEGTMYVVGDLALIAASPSGQTKEIIPLAALRSLPRMSSATFRILAATESAIFLSSYESRKYSPSAVIRIPRADSKPGVFLDLSSEDILQREVAAVEDVAVNGKGLIALSVRLQDGNYEIRLVDEGKQRTVFSDPSFIKELQFSANGSLYALLSPEDAPKRKIVHLNT